MNFVTPQIDRYLTKPSSPVIKNYQDLALLFGVYVREELGDDLVLVHVLKNVGSVQEHAHRTAEGDTQEDEEEETIQHSGHVLPVIQDLKPNTFHFENESQQLLQIVDLFVQLFVPKQLKISLAK